MASHKYKIREICGDWALDIHWGMETITLFFNSRNNADLVKAIMEWEDAHPNEAVPYKPTLTPPNEWVSVDERLPETDGQNTHDYDVLVYIPKRDGCHQHGIYIGKLKKVPADDGSWNFWGIKTEPSEWTVWGWGYLENPVVTHWMPLPAPPDCRPPEGEA